MTGAADPSADRVTAAWLSAHRRRFANGSVNGRAVLREIDGFPPVLQAIVALDAWSSLDVLQHAAWLGQLQMASILRQGGLTTAAHLAALNLGLKSIPVDRRLHHSCETRLMVLFAGIISRSRFWAQVTRSVDPCLAIDGAEAGRSAPNVKAARGDRPVDGAAACFHRHGGSSAVVLSQE